MVRRVVANGCAKPLWVKRVIGKRFELDTLPGDLVAHVQEQVGCWPRGGRGCCWLIGRG